MVVGGGGGGGEQGEEEEGVNGKNAQIDEVDTFS